MPKCRTNALPSALIPYLFWATTITSLALFFAPSASATTLIANGDNIVVSQSGAPGLGSTIPGGVHDDNLYGQGNGGGEFHLANSGPQGNASSSCFVLKTRRISRPVTRTKSF
jgi:hypothetical protein